MSAWDRDLMFRVEPVRTDDFAAILRVVWKTLPGPIPAPFLQHVAQQEPRHFCVVRETETGRVRRFMTAIRQPGTAGRIILLAVDPDYRDLGLRRQLVAVMQGILKDEGERFFAVEVATVDGATIDFFRRQGYQVVGVDEPGVTMAKGLA